MQVRVGRCLLREHLESRKITQLQLAEKLGVYEQAINRYVNNRAVMSYQIAKNIADILECDMDDLYEWERVSINE